MPGFSENLKRELQKQGTQVAIRKGQTLESLTKMLCWLTSPGILQMPFREAGDPVNGQSQNIALVTNSRSFVRFYI